MAPAPGFEPESSGRQPEMIGQATPRERDAGPELFVYRLYQIRITYPCLGEMLDSRLHYFQKILQIHLLPS